LFRFVHEFRLCLLASLYGHTGREWSKVYLGKFANNSLVEEKVDRGRSILDLDHEVDGAVFIALGALREPLQEGILTWGM
jgi:hypothetical protein